MKKHFLIIWCLLFNLYILQAQNELTFPHLENVLQSSYINPAHVPNYKLSIGLPGISSIQVAMTNTGFAVHDLVQPKEKGVHHFNWLNMLSKLDKENYVYAAANSDLFSIRFKVQHYYWSFNITEKLTSRLSYPKDLITLAVKGNEPFIGGELSLQNSGIDFTHRREFGVGIVKQYRKVIIGIRGKYIQGLSNVYTKTKNLGLVTGAEYFPLKATTDASLNTSGFMQKGSGDFSVREYLTNTSNPGAGLDLGLTYKLAARWVVSAAVNNIGFIQWKSNLANYSIKGGTEFRGADLGKDLLEHVGDTSDFAEKEVDKYLDSLKNSFNYQEGSARYRTYLIPQIYLTAKYQLRPKTQAIASVYLEKFIVLRPAFTLGIYQEIGRVVNAIATYSIQYGRFDNFGLGLVIKPPVVPIQFYFAGDNLFNKYSYDNSYVAPLDAKNFNFRFGINLVFGSIKPAEKQPYPEK